MKKLLIALLLTNIATAQHVYFALGGDLRNGIVGSNPTENKPELNCSLEFKMVGNNNVEVGIGFEQFNRIDFNRMYITAGYRFEIGELTFIPTIEPTLINRYDNWGGGIDYEMKQSFLTVGLGSALEYSFNEKLGVQLYCGVLSRPDIKLMFDENKVVVSGFAKLIYKINI